MDKLITLFEFEDGSSVELKPISEEQIRRHETAIILDEELTDVTVGSEFRIVTDKRIIYMKATRIEVLS